MHVEELRLALNSLALVALYRWDAHACEEMGDNWLVLDPELIPLRLARFALYLFYLLLQLFHMSRCYGHIQFIVQDLQQVSETLSCILLREPFEVRNDLSEELVEWIRTQSSCFWKPQLSHDLSQNFRKYPVIVLNELEFWLFFQWILLVLLFLLLLYLDAFYFDFGVFDLFDWVFLSNDIFFLWNLQICFFLVDLSTEDWVPSWEFI